VKAHLIGVGGVGMAPLADLLLKRGWEVSGCDQSGSDGIRALTLKGARITVGGHDPAHVRGRDLLVHTSRLNEAGEREREAARQSGVRVLSRTELLAELIAGGPAVGVAGTHGKTTITAMVSHTAAAGGLDPVSLVGDGQSSRSGAGDLLIAELDESDARLAMHRPSIAAVSNVEFDHGDFYADLAAVQRGFRDFLDGLPQSGLAILCADDPWLRGQSVPGRLLTYGFAPHADYQVWPGGRVELNGAVTVQLNLRVPGRHNLQNAVAALAAAVELGMTPVDAARALSDFPGARRRLEHLGNWRGAAVYDDYGHLPAEVRVTVEAARELPYERVVLVFQPHRYSRYVDLRQEFVPEIASADRTLVTEIYGAGEANPGGVSAAWLADAAGCAFVPSLDAARDWLEREVRPRDLVLLMGAGDIRTLGDELASR
jgi:UDP-N-acetylmuramate--alanine ligase